MSKEKNLVMGTSESFKVLVQQLTEEIEKNKQNDHGQKKDLEDLMAAERNFRDALMNSPRGLKMFDHFIRWIRFEKNDILSARPFFRESASSFSEKVTPCLKEVNAEELSKQKINILFAKWVKDNWRGSFPTELAEAYNEIDKIRTRLIINNMPLAINQAKQFFRKVPLSYIEFTDLIAWSAAGLASGIDKWARDDWEPLFRSVCIGRMKGNMIESYSQTMVYFYPQDRRILYKANSIKFKEKIEDIDELAVAVNKAFKEAAEKGVRPIKEEVTGAQLRLLLAAASHVGAETSATEDESYTTYSTTADSYDMEEQVIKNDLMKKTYLAAKTLPMIQRKVLKLKGGLE